MQNLIAQTKGELLSFFNARTWGALERQFNADGRQARLFLSVGGRDTLIVATAMDGPNSRLRTLTFPLHASDFLGVVELDRALAEASIAAE